MASPGAGHEYPPVSFRNLNFTSHKLMTISGASLMAEGPHNSTMESFF